MQQPLNSERAERRREYLREHKRKRRADPEYKARELERQREIHRGKLANPEYRERQREHHRACNMTAEQLERARERKRKWIQSDPEKHRERKRKQLAKLSPDKKRDRWLRYTYKCTLQQWQQIFDAQGKCCAICKTTEPGSKKGWHTDHCHDGTGVRGILCKTCNVSMGGFKDNIELLQSAIDYLSGHAAKAVLHGITAACAKFYC